MLAFKLRRLLENETIKAEDLVLQHHHADTAIVSLADIADSVTDNGNAELWLLNNSDYPGHKVSTHTKQFPDYDRSVYRIVEVIGLEKLENHKTKISRVSRTEDRKITLDL